VCDLRLSAALLGSNGRIAPQVFLVATENHAPVEPDIYLDLVVFPGNCATVVFSSDQKSCPRVWPRYARSMPVSKLWSAC